MGAHNIKSFWRAYCLPCLAFAALLVAIAFTPSADIGPSHRDIFETVAWHLGREVNSAWVALCFALVTVPSLRAWRHGRPDGWAWRAADAAVLVFLIVDVIGRRFIALPRPSHTGTYGFPSGHATLEFLTAWLLWSRYPKLGPLGFAVAVVIGWSRIEIHAHYPYQVFAGALFGMATGALVVNRTGGVILPRLILPDGALLKLMDQNRPKSEANQP